MSKRSNGQAVYIVSCPEGWRPTRPWSLPPSFTSAELYQKKLPTSTARGFAVTFNYRAIQAMHEGVWDGRWAIVARNLYRVRERFVPERSVSAVNVPGPNGTAPRSAKVEPAAKEAMLAVPVESRGGAI